MADEIPETNVTGDRNAPEPTVTPEDISAVDAMLDGAEAAAAADEQAAIDNPVAPVTPEPDDNSLFEEITGKPAPEEVAAEPTAPAADPEKPEEEKPPVEPAPAAEVAPEIDPEIAAIEEPANITDAAKENWKKLRETAQEYKKKADAAAALEARVKELEATPKIPDDYEELKKFRAAFDTEHDPEFKSKYETPIAEATETFYEILKKNGAPDSTLDSIKELGGPDKVDAGWLEKNIISKLPLVDRKRVEDSVVKVTELKDGREKEIKEAAEKRPQILAERETAQKKMIEDHQQKVMEVTEQLTKDIPWAHYREAKPDATPEVKAEIEAWNKRVDGLGQQFRAALWPTTPEARANVAVAATATPILAEQVRIEQARVADLQKQIDALTKENAGLKGAGRLPKPGANSQQGPSKPSTGDRLKMNSADAIDAGLDDALGS